METAFEYVPVTLGSAALADAEEINCEAFPAVERRSVEDMVRTREFCPGSAVTAVYEGDECVGFFHTVEMERFVYGAYFAVTARKRGQGYGSRILKAMLDHCNGKPFLGEVEYPFEDAENYDQRVARIRFYERNGIINTLETIDHENLGGRYYIISSVKDAPIDEYRTFIAEAVRIAEAARAARAE